MKIHRKSAGAGVAAVLAVVGLGGASGVAMSRARLASQAESAAVSTVPNPGAADYGKFYWKAWEPLDLDGSRVAVKARTIDNLRAAGIDAGAAAAFAVDGWWL